MQDYWFFPNVDRLKFLIEKEQDAKLDPTQRLTNQEETEKNELYNQGFLDWSWNEYQKFVQSLDMFAPDNYEKISSYIWSKSVEEVEKYAKVFFKRLNEL